ncbi:LLM class flavin-dependent oxidoreductase [Brevibacillus borstelensis]|uniref:LLM class flavin-dependent oxidoreductase n=1 Tax=Brevibacillus borstelensis TaxID=45462 RepID=UPI0030BD6647
MSIRVSILDQSPIGKGESAEDAFRHTIALAQTADELGYHRFWVSEHHNSDEVVGSSPEVLLAYLAAKTRRIRLGSGGVMLQHYSPYKVAENFQVLASLAPGRIDLGIGRAPGGLPLSTRALQQEDGTPKPLEQKLAELDAYLSNRIEKGHPLDGLRATPLPREPAAIYLLGTSVSSAELAAQAGLPYVFAQFINGDEPAARDAFALYRNRFRARYADDSVKSEAILALAVIVAATDQEAREWAAEYKNVKIRLESGRVLTVNSIEAAEAFGEQSREKYTIEVKEANIIAGSRDTVRQKLLELQRAYLVDELIITVPLKDFQRRLGTFVQVKEAFADESVPSR